MTKHTPDLATVLAEAGGSRRKVQAEAEPHHEPYAQPGRAGTKPITGHFPKEVRSELKKLAIEQETTLQNLMAEAFNDLFAKYGKPEICQISVKG
jgi:hypothetical protein